MVRPSSRWVALALAAAFFLQGWLGNRDKSLTWDEPVFIASGYTYLARGDFRMNREAPPLLQELAALPLLSSDVQIVPEDHPVWRSADHFALGRHFAEANSDRLEALGRRSRLPFLLLGAGLIVLIHEWGRRLYGRGPALAAAALAAASPNLLAHAKVAATDLGCAAFMFCAVFSFWRATETRRATAWAACGVVTGLALLTKYTALLLGPVYLLLASFCIRRGRLSWGASLRAAGIVAVGAVGVVAAGYGPSFDPRLYVDGLRQVYVNTSATYPFYLLGNVSQTPWWHYHLVAFALKTPLSTLALLVVAAGVALRRSAGREAAVFLLAPALLVLAVSCFDRGNVGYRRILPALPFLLLFAAHALVDAPSRLRRGLVLGLICLSVLEAVRIYPHHLAYFQPLVGGPERGPYLLDDSNIDWGQDLPGLAAWQREHPDAEPLRLSYFGSVPPRAYGVHAVEVPLTPDEFVAPRSGYYAVSVHHLVWLRKMKALYGVSADWLATYRPIDRIGYSIHVYRFPGPDDPRQD